MKFTKRRLRLAAILLIVAFAIMTGISLVTEAHGVGSYDIRVMLKSAKPFRSVSYCFFRFSAKSADGSERGFLRP